MLILFLLVPWIGTFSLYAQTDQDDPDYSSYVESVFSSQEDQIAEDVFESFLQTYHQPFNLNAVDREDLRSILLLDDQEITYILEHRQKYGSFLSFQELYLINGIDSAKVEMIKKFLIVEPVAFKQMDSLRFLKRVLQYGQSSLTLRYSRILEKRRGFLSRSDPDEVLKKRYYVGSPDQLYVRFTMEVPDDLKIGLTAEKDAGEPIYFSPKDKAYGMDHYAGFIQKKYHSWLKSFTLGDFKIQSGQGVVMGNGLLIGKGTEPIRTAVRFDQGARPYQGATEYGFYRGLALELGGKRWSTTSFVSYKGVDANLEFQDRDEMSAVIRSIQNTGYHRTPAELLKKNSASMTSAGLLCLFQSDYKNFSMGISGIWNELSQPLIETRNYYNLFDFSGRRHFNAGIHYNYYRGKLNVFGEVALSKMKGLGAVQGIIANLGPSIETIVHIRYYDKKYFSFTGRSFGEFTTNNNEQGIYWGIKLHPWANLDIHFYFDMFRSYWLRYATASPASGYDWMTFLKYTLGQYSGIDLYYQDERKMRNLPAELGKEYTLESGRRRKARLCYHLDPLKGIMLRSRIQAEHYEQDQTGTFGFSLIQNVGYKFARGYIKGGISYFRTDDFLTRQYVYEPDVLYYFSVPAYYGHGLRYLVVLKMRPIRNIDCWIKGGQYYFFDRETIGTGMDELSGHKKTEIRCQIRIKF
jgi:hypothetical protein